MNNLNKKIEIAIKSFLEDQPEFSSVPIYAHHESDEASESHPSIIAYCESTDRDTDLPLSMNAYKANLKCILMWDYKDGDSSAIEEYLEVCLSSLPALQELFNLQDPPIPRPVEGIHVHYIESATAESETDGTIKMLTIENTLVLEQVTL